MKFFVILATGLLAFACSSGSGGGGATNTPNNNNCAKGEHCITTTPPGPDAFGETKEQIWAASSTVDLSTPAAQQAAANEIYSIGCDVQGKQNPYPDTNLVADSRLSVGSKMQIYQSIWVKNQGPFGYLTIDSSVTAISSDKKSITQHYSVADSANLTGIQAGQAFDQTCTVDSTGAVACPQPTARLLQSRADLNLNGNCTVDAQNFTSQTLERGVLTVKLPTGAFKQVKAYRFHAIADGNFKTADPNAAACSLTGAGRLEFAQYFSNDVASPSFSQCGGTTMIQFQKLSQGGVTQRLDLSENREQQ